MVVTAYWWREFQGAVQGGKIQIVSGVLCLLVRKGCELGETKLIKIGRIEKKKELHGEVRVARGGRERGREREIQKFAEDFPQVFR